MQYEYADLEPVMDENFYRSSPSDAPFQPPDDEHFLSEFGEVVVSKAKGEC